MGIIPETVTTYPDVTKIRATLQFASARDLWGEPFCLEGLKVCDEAEKRTECAVSGAQVLDTQVIAKLQFIEKVLGL